MSVKAIAEILGVARGTVSKLKEAAGGTLFGWFKYTDISSR